VREAIRIRHYSIRSEEAYVQWVKAFIRFHGLRHPREMGAREVTTFLSHPATGRNVAAATQDDLVRPLNGWQVPPDDLEALTLTLLSALSDPIRLRQMGAESYRIVNEEVNVESMAGVFVQVVSQVCAYYS